LRAPYWPARLGRKNPAAQTAGSGFGLPWPHARQLDRQIRAIDDDLLLRPQVTRQEERTRTDGSNP